MKTASSMRSHATLVWLVLVFATSLSWWLVEHHAVPARVATTAALAIAAFGENLQLDLIFVEVELLECRVDCVVYGGTGGLNACHVSSPCPGQVAVGVLRQ